MKTVKHLRLVNNEEVIAEVTKETKESLVLRNPYMVIELPETVSLAKYVPFSAEQVVEIKKVHIITITELHEEMVRYYDNTIQIGKNAAEKAMAGLKNINDVMEDYIYDKTVSSEVYLQYDDIEPSSNTYH